MTAQQEPPPQSGLPDLSVSTSPVAAYGIARPSPGRAGDLLAAIASVIPHVRVDAGYQLYEVAELLTEPGALVLYERWASGPDFERHLLQPYMRTYLETVSAILAVPFDVQWARPVAF